MKISIFEDKCAGAMVCAAIGDALGWPNEFRAKNMSKTKVQDDFFVKWSRRCGGQYWNHDEVIRAGEYSDDTQMIIATARCLLRGPKWNVHFTKNELPYWLEYERGGGSALKRAAHCWRDRGNTPWDTKNKEKDIHNYYNAGGNGVAMRILPHVIYNLNGSVNTLMEDVMRSGMYTHGHPRALIGATCYAYALWILAHKQSVLEYGELINEVISGQDIWGKFYFIPNTTQWLEGANVHVEKNYLDLWSECVNKTVEGLLITKKSINKGLLDMGNEALIEIGCFDKQVNGAGDVAAISAIYLASKYASNPKLGIKEAAFMHGTDTDTIASMVGGLLGMLHGTQWIPTEWRIVQDYDFLIKLSNALVSADENFDEMIARMNNNELQENHEWRSTPIGKISNVEHWIIKTTKSSEISITKAITAWGQTIFIKQYSRITVTNNMEYNRLQNVLVPSVTGNLEFDSQMIQSLLQQPIQKLGFKKVLQIAGKLLSGQSDSALIASELNTQVQYVDIIKGCVKNNNR